MNGFFEILLLLGLLGQNVYIVESRCHKKAQHDEQPQELTQEPITTTEKLIKTEDCECVPFYQCHPNTTINTSGEDIIDIRGQECDHYMDKCCNLTTITKNPIIPDTKHEGTCGKRNVDGIGFRISGDAEGESQFGEFPWMVAVIQDLHEKNIYQYQCGGSLIHKEVVLTAAHCVIDKRKKFIVRAGEWDTQTTNEIFPYQERKVKSVIVHPNYYSGGFYNDVALLILETPIELVNQVDVVCLPNFDIVIPNGTRCYATGWGKDKYGKEGKYQVILKKIELPIVDKGHCEGNLRKTRLGSKFNLHASFVCAGGELGKDTCNGDGGSPLVCEIPDKHEHYQQIGLVSWGLGCGEQDLPGLYANIPYLRKWIDEQLEHSQLGIVKE